LTVQPRANLELVALPFLDAGEEDLPHTRWSKTAHRMQPPVPTVEVADDADAIGVGRPHTEVDSIRFADPHQVRAELVINARVLALRKQVHVVFGDDTSVAIRVVDLDRVSTGTRDAQAIVED